MLTLATRLRASDDSALHRGIQARALPAGGIRDFFDLAEAFLAPDAVQHAFAGLTRPTLAVLAVAAELSSTATRATGQPAPRLEDIAARVGSLRGSPVELEEVAAHAGILDASFLAVLDDGRLYAYDAVAERLAAWPAEGLPDTAALVNTPDPAEFSAGPETDLAFIDRLAAEHAFGVVSSIVELVNELSREPVRELSRGGLGLPDTKRLAQVMSVEAESVAPLVAIAQNAGLVALSASQWLDTDAAEGWLRGGSADRWGALAATWQRALPDDVRAVLPRTPGARWNEQLEAAAAWLYPAGGQRMQDRLSEVARDAALLGIVAAACASTAGAAVLTGDIDGAVTALTTHLPPEVDRVYLQNDLSIVSPGPTAPAVDARLRTMADVESRELASSYRISAASVNRALTAGENAESILEFLRDISLTGIPQPLEYLITESASRYGRVRVGRLTDGPDSAQSYVRSDDPALLTTIAVDQSLAALALQHCEGRLISRSPVDSVFWGLAEAKYPVAAEGNTGEVLRVRRPRPRPVPRSAAPDPIEALIAKVRASDGEGDTGRAWLVKQLEAAIRTRQLITVNIAMPGGGTADFLLEPASIGGGRFRAKDRKADIERTLPLSSVISIAPAL